MNRHPRKPALLVLLVAVTLGALYVTAWGKIEQLWKKKPQGIEALEQQIKSGNASAATWRAYGEALMNAKDFGRAANAFRQVLAMEPSQRDAKFQCGLALAQSGAADEFYNFQKDLVFSEAKLAVELFDRPETHQYLSQERFASLAKEAKNQAMD